MPFDPSLPQENTLIDAAQMRDQLNGLNDTIAAGIAGTAQNPSLGPLSIALSDPPTRPEVQQIVDFLNTLLNQITRV